jgi:hypothetical protein
VSWKKIAVLLLFLAILAAAIMYVNQKEKDRQAVEGTLLAMPSASVEKVELRNSNGRFVFSRRDMTWFLDAPLTAKAEKVALESILDNYCQLKYDRLVAENAVELKDFGLDRPEIELKLFAKDGPATTILLGTNNPLDGSSYARLAGGKKVVTIASYKRGDLEKDLFAFRDKKFFGIDAMAIGALEFRHENSSFSFRKEEGRWFLEKPVHSLAQESKVSDILASASNLEALSFAPAPGSGAYGEFGLDKPILIAEFRSPSDARKIAVGRKGEQYYALAEGAAEICGIAKDFLDKFSIDAAAFREKKVALFFAFDVREIAFRQGAFGFTAHKDAAGTWEYASPVSGGKPDQEKIERLLTSLADLEAEGFIDGAKALPPFPTRIALKTEDPADPGKQGAIVIEFAAADGETVIIRNPALPYLFKANKEILAKLPANLGDLCEDEAKAK